MIDVGAKAIIVVSETGTTARQVAKFRPGRPIFCLTSNVQVARQCCGILRGVQAIVINDYTTLEYDIQNTIESFRITKFCQPGDAIVVITGTIQQKGATNLMRVQYA